MRATAASENCVPAPCDTSIPSIFTAHASAYPGERASREGGRQATYIYHRNGDETGPPAAENESLTRIHALPLPGPATHRAHTRTQHTRAHARTRAAGSCVRTRSTADHARDSSDSLAPPRNANFVARPRAGGANFQHPRLHSPAGLGALFLLGHPLATLSWSLPPRVPMPGIAAAAARRRVLRKLIIILPARVSRNEAY